VILCTFFMMALTFIVILWIRCNMKTAIIYSTMLSIGALGSAFTWGPGAVETTRDFMIEPALVAIKEQSTLQTSIMAGMKHYDIRTDELADDCRRLQNRIREAQKALAEAPSTSAKYRQYLEGLIREAEEELQQKQGMLDQATRSDRDILTVLQGSTA